MIRSLLNLQRLIPVLVVAMAALTLAGYWWQQELSHERLREETLQRTERHAVKLAEAVALQADEMVRGFDIALRHMAADYLEYPPSFAGSVQAIVQTYPAAARIAVAVTDAEGYLVFRSSGLQGRIYVGDRDYFTFHRDSAKDRLYVTKPILSRLSNVWNIHLVRKLVNKGRFAGVIMIVVPVEYVSSSLSRLLLNEGDVISLFAQDGEYMSRSSDLANAMGKSVPKERPFLGPDAPVTGVFRTIAAFDKVPRIYGWQRMETVPLVVNVGLATTAVVAPIERQLRQEHVFGMIGTAVVIVGLGAIVLLLSINAGRYQVLREREAELRVNKTVFDAATEGMFVTDADNRILAVNPAFTAITGYTAAEVIGQTPSLLSSGRHDAAFYGAMRESLARDGRWEGELVNRHKSGRLFDEWLKIAAVGEGRERRYVALLSDITVKKRREEEMWQRANFDELTGLPNRALLADRMAQALARAARSGSQLGVLFIDLDRFKPVNDRYGHQAGDDLLKQVATRIGNCLREEDTVARLGGDEFLALLPAIRDAEVATSVADKVLASLLAPFKIEQYFVEIGASIGVAIYPAHGSSVEELLEKADVAMYRAKEAGHHTVRLYSE
jgi:diguanylate cyclase (GGDEF)-like protein/PAS domain S-box-containing protein